MIYISTDYVFPGTEGEAPYEVDAPTDPPNLYGQTKLEGEKALHEETDGTGLSLVLRVPVLYGKCETPAESAVNVLLEQVWKAQEEERQGHNAASKKIKMDDWALRYPTNTEDVARVIQDLAVMYLSESSEARRAQLPRLLHFSSEDRFTKYEICQLLAEILGLPLDGMMPDGKGNDPGKGVQRPYDCHLSTKALKELGIRVHTQDFKAWW